VLRGRAYNTRPALADAVTGQDKLRLALQEGSLPERHALELLRAVRSVLGWPVDMVPLSVNPCSSAFTSGGSPHVEPVVLLSRAFSTSAGGTVPMILRPYMAGAEGDTGGVEEMVDVSQERAAHDVDDSMEVMPPPAIKREPGTEDMGADAQDSKRKREEAGE
jgi:hypothetical protein